MPSRKILNIYIKLSKLRKCIDIVRRNLIKMYLKEKFINNRLSIRSDTYTESIFNMLRL